MQDSLHRDYSLTDVFALDNILMREYPLYKGYVDGKAALKSTLINSTNSKVTEYILTRLPTLTNDKNSIDSISEMVSQYKPKTTTLDCLLSDEERIKLDTAITNLAYSFTKGPESSELNDLIMQKAFLDHQFKEKIKETLGEAPTKEDLTKVKNQLKDLWEGYKKNVWFFDTEKKDLKDDEITRATEHYLVEHIPTKLFNEIISHQNK